MERAREMKVQENETAMGDTNKYKKMDPDSDGVEEDIALLARVRKKNAKRFVLACAIFASLNTLLVGYDVGVMSGALLFIQEDLKISELQEEVFVGILSIISLLGSLAGGKSSDAIGRKWTIAFSAVIFQSGAAIMALAPSFPALMFGRLLAGVGIGFGVMISPVYIAEISPSTVRGFLTSLPEICVNLGILLGYISNYAFSGLPIHINWRVMLGVGILPSIFIGFALFVMPESPRWLVMQNRIEEARLVLSKMNDSESEVEERLAEIQLAAGLVDAENHEGKAVWREILNPSPAVRQMLITGCGIQFFQQITGIEATVYYSPTIFKAAGIKSNTQLFAVTIAVGFTKTLFILIPTFFIDKVGRKPLLFISTIGMTISLFCLSLILSYMGDGKLGIQLAVLSVCANVAFFSVGLGPVCWVLSSEIYPLRLRAQASAVGSVGNRVSSGLVTMSFLSVSRAITVGGTFFIFALISTLSVIFIHSWVPETKGKSLEQIERLFEDKGDRQKGLVEMRGVERLVHKE